MDSLAVRLLSEDVAPPMCRHSFLIATHLAHLTVVICSSATCRTTRSAPRHQHIEKTLVAFFAVGTRCIAVLISETVFVSIDIGRCLSYQSKTSFIQVK